MRINLIGKHANIGWGMEGLVNRALQQLGHEVTFGDIRDEVLAWLPPADLNFIIQGYGLGPDAIAQLKRRMPIPLALWHGEVLGDRWPTDDAVVQAKVRELIKNIFMFDVVLHNCETSLPLLKRFGAKAVQAVLVSGVDPLVHRRLDGIEKKIDVLIYGWPCPRRRAWVQETLKHLPAGVSYAWPEPEAGYYGEFLTQLINCARLVLNVRYSATPNTETRLFEALGCGVPVVSEPISMPSIFPGGVGVRYGETPEALATQIATLLALPDAAYLEVADAGYHFVHEHHSYHTRCQEALSAITAALS